jgi:hydrogenase expression/formation protein HypC
MCLAIPGKVLECQAHGGFRTGRVQFGGIVRPICLDFVPEAQLGDFVMVHVGFAISVVNREEAERTYQVLQAMGVLEEELQPTEAERDAQSGLVLATEDEAGLKPARRWLVSQETW